MTLEWTWLSYHGNDIQSLTTEVRQHVEPAKSLISVHDYRHLCCQHRTDNVYILARFKRVVSSLSESKNGPIFRAEFEDVSYCGPVTAVQSASLFCVTFLKDIATKLSEYVCEKKLVTGGIVHFVQPWVLSEERNRVSALSLLVTSSKSTKQIVHLWRQHSVLFVDSYPFHSDHSYTHMDFYGYSSTGSFGQAVQNVLKLADGKGVVTNVDDIVNKKSPQKCVVLTKYIKLVTPLKVYNETPEIQLSFEEIVMYPSKKSVKSFSNLFKAYFFGSIASELHKSLDNKLLEPGDLVAICQPIIKKKTAAPIDIMFSPRTKLCLYILKDQEKITKFQLNKYQTPHRSQKCTSVTKLNKEFSFNIEKFDILLFENLNEDLDILKIFIKELKKNGNILSLNSFANNDQIIKNKNDFVILTCILKVVLPVRISNRRLTAILFARELARSGSFGCFFKIILYDKFAKKMCLALEDKQIVQGDVVAFVNPCVSLSPAFVPQTLREEEPFILELTSANVQQKIVVCKICRTDKDNVKVPAKCSKTLIKSCIRCTASQSIEDYNNGRGKLTKKKNETVICNEMKSQTKNVNLKVKHSINSLDVPSSNSHSNTTCNKHCQTITTIIDPDEAKFPKKNNFEQSISEEDLSIFPFRVEKPETGNELDFVSGYCGQKCHNMFVYSVLLWNVEKEPVCPNCHSPVRLGLCFQIMGLSRSGRHVSALLVGEAAEIFLQVRSLDFISDWRERGMAFARLRKAMPDSYANVKRNKEHYTLKLTDVTFWWYKNHKS